ncbi:reverse transcriptase domain-containing protein [Tanacetum coccineum]
MTSSLHSRTGFETIVAPYGLERTMEELVQANPFNGRENENPHAHINSFKRITSTLRFRNVSNDVIKLMMFPYSLEGAAKTWMNATSSKTDERIDKLADQLSTLVEIVSKKVVTFRPHVSQKSFPEKLGDPTSFIFHVISQLAVGSISFLKDAEDVFVKVGKFHFPTDFVVVDFEADPRVPLILGRSFLRTGRALIDVYGEEITLRVDNEAVTFNLDQTTRYSSTNDKSVNRIDIIDAVCEEYAPEFLGFPNSSGGNPTPTSEPFTSEFILEEIEAYLKDDSISPEIDHADFNPEEDICLIEKLLNNDPFQLPPMDLKQSEVTEAKSSIEEPPELELKDLPSHLEYAFLEENDKLPVIIAKGLKNDEKDALLKVLKSHKGAIAWKITDIKDDRNLDGNEFFCFLDGFSGYFQIPIDPQDQEKTTFTCPYRTFAYRRMPFGLCNAPGTFQRCMMAIFHDMIEKTMEVFMDDFSVLGIEKCHFMCKEGIVLGHKISKLGIEVDRAKVDVIAKLLNQTIVKGVRVAVVGPMRFKTYLERRLEKIVASWSDKLDEALWVFRTAFKTPIGCTPYKLVYGKSCHLPIELEHKAYWALKHANFDLKTASDHRTNKAKILNMAGKASYYSSSSSPFTHVKSKGNSQLRARKDNSSVKVHLGRGKRYPSNLIGQALMKNHTWIMKEAQGMMGFILYTLTKEAQRLLTHGCHVGNPCALQSNPTTLSDDPMIEGIYGQD